MRSSLAHPTPLRARATLLALALLAVIAVALFAPRCPSTGQAHVPPSGQSAVMALDSAAPVASVEPAAPAADRRASLPSCAQESYATAAHPLEHGVDEPAPALPAPTQDAAAAAVPGPEMPPAARLASPTTLTPQDLGISRT